MNMALWYVYSYQCTLCKGNFFKNEDILCQVCYFLFLVLLLFGKILELSRYESSLLLLGFDFLVAFESSDNWLEGINWVLSSDNWLDWI